MESLNERLSALAGEQDQTVRVDGYRVIAREVVRECARDDKDAMGTTKAELETFVEHCVSEHVPLAISREIITDMSKQLPSLESDVHKTIADVILARIQPRLVSFEEQVRALREDLATRYAREEHWTRAAEVLAGIDLDSGVRTLSNAFKLRKCVEIAELYAEGGDLVQADLFISRARLLRASGEADASLDYQYNSCWATVLDRKGKFMDASDRYYALAGYDPSTLESQTAQKHSLVDVLTLAVACAVIAPTGPQRLRMLQTLYKDERCAQLSVFAFLEKVYLERLLRVEEVLAFERFLKPHHLAVDGDSLSALQRAVVEHNLVSMSNVYNNIGFDELGELLGVSDIQAEKMVAKMISEDRLSGRIDQVDRFVYFDSDASTIEEEWDKQVVEVSLTLNGIVETLTAKQNETSSDNV